MTKPRTDKYSASGHARHASKDETRRMERTAKHRYVFLVGSKREKRKMRKELRYEVMDYPKGNSQHYDISKPEPIIDCRKVINEKTN